MKFDWNDTSSGKVVSYSTCASWLDCDCRLVAVVHLEAASQIWHVMIFDEMGLPESWLVNTESITAVQTGFYDRIGAQGFAEASLLTLLGLEWPLRATVDDDPQSTDSSDIEEDWDYLLG